jgi:hypothetical protein
MDVILQMFIDQDFELGFLQSIRAIDSLMIALDMPLRPKKKTSCGSSHFLSPSLSASSTRSPLRCFCSQDEEDMAILMWDLKSRKLCDRNGHSCVKINNDIWYSDEVAVAMWLLISLNVGGWDVGCVLRRAAMSTRIRR